jgi:hypothetical protein
VAPPIRSLRRPDRPLVSLVDRCLPPPLFRRLARAVRTLGTEGLARTYQTTFWFDLGHPAALPEEAVLALRARVPALRAPSIAGAEWWLSRMRTSDVRVDFHRDRDEVLFRRTGRLAHPALSSILFLNRCRGGLLAVTARAPDERNAALAPAPLDGDLVRPWPNRFVFFAGDVTHGVLDADNAVPHRRLAPPTPLRLALVVNWWSRRPTDVPRFADTRRYRALALGGARARGS